MTYADTSALVKLLVAEPETPAVSAFLSAVKDRTTSSMLTIAELKRTARRAGVRAAGDLLLKQIDLLTVDEPGLWRAGRLATAAGTYLRTADAIHLIAAMELGESDFLTYDRRQAQAAADRGFTVISPGRPEDWYLQPATG